MKPLSARDCYGGSDVVRSKPKPTRAARRAKLVKAADATFSLYIRARDPHCVTCGQPTEHCSHIFRRGHRATCWDENNAVGQCARCHFIHHNQTESYLLDYAKGKLGKKRYEEMRDRWNGISQWKPYQIEEVARFYREKVSHLGGQS